MSLAHDVAGQQFYALDQRQNLSIDNHRSQMTRNYFESVYFSMYEAPAKERENQLHAIPVREIWNHLDEIRPYVMSEINHFTEGLMNMQPPDVNKLRMPPKPKLGYDDNWLNETIGLKH